MAATKSRITALDSRQKYIKWIQSLEQVFFYLLLVGQPVLTSIFYHSSVVSSCSWSVFLRCRSFLDAFVLGSCYWLYWLTVVMTQFLPAWTGVTDWLVLFSALRVFVLELLLPPNSLNGFCLYKCAHHIQPLTAPAVNKYKAETLTLWPVHPIKANT